MRCPVHSSSLIPPPLRYRTKTGVILWAAYGALDRSSHGRPNLFNLQKAAEKDGVWRARDRARELQLPKHIRAAEEKFDAERLKLLGKLSRSDGTLVDLRARVDLVLAETAPEWAEVVSGIYLDAADTFGRRTWDAFARASQRGVFKQRRSERVFKTISRTGDPWAVAAVRWLSSPHAGKKIVGINETTRRQVMAELRAGVKAGATTDQLAARIDTLYLDKIIPYRSEVIARTEHTQASSMASQSAAKATGFPLEKEWWTAQDARVRPQKGGGKYSHVKAHGQRRDMDEPYDISGQPLRFPGDQMNGSAGNVIQCRCLELYHEKESDGTTVAVPEGPGTLPTPATPVPEALPAEYPGNYLTVSSAEADMAKRYPKTLFDFDGLNLEATNGVTKEIDRLAVKYPQVWDANMKYVGTYQNASKFPSDVGSPGFWGEDWRLKYAGWSGKNGRDIAHAHWSGLIGLNPKKMNKWDDLGDLVRTASKNGWFAQGAQYAGPDAGRYVLSHEFGHIVDYYCQEWSHRDAALPGLKAVRPDGLGAVRGTFEWFMRKSDPFRERVSGYAKTNQAEGWAESFATREVIAKEHWTPYTHAQDDFLKLLEKSEASHRPGMVGTGGHGVSWNSGTRFEGDDLDELLQSWKQIEEKLNPAKR